MKRLALVVGILASLAISQVANATTANYADTALNWATWTAATNNDNDPFGSPSIVSTSVTTTDTTLNNITFNGNIDGHYNVWTNTYTIFSGDLFIDTGANQTWDYVVRALGTNLNGSAILGLYSINVALNDASKYAMSYYNNDPNNYRSGLPVGLLNTPSSQSYLGAVSYSADSTKISFDFGANSPLSFGSDFIIGYAVTCANDVVYQQVPVPEPGTMVLLGAGLLGLAVFGKRRMGKSA